VSAERRSGHGRWGAKAYPDAEQVVCRHDALVAGQRCPACGRGTLCPLPAGVEIRIDGNALLTAVRYELERLRCSACGRVFTAPLPVEAGKEERHGPGTGGVGAVAVFPTPMVLGPEASNATRFFSEGDPDIPNNVWRYLRSIGAKGLLRLPMLLGEATIGWVTVRSGERQMPNLDSKIGFIEALSRQATLAIQMARLGEEARESAVLTERNRMARDIHDTLAQGFTGIITQLQAADDALARDGTDAVQSHIARATELARQSLSEARRSVRALRPRALEDVPLATAIHSMIRKLTDGTDIRPEVTVLGKPWPLVVEWEEELLRIVQEALTSTLKHANASLFEVKLVFEGNGLQLEIRDDGIGFDATGQHEGFGLMGMSERANRVGGKLTVLSLPGKGAEIRVALPPGQTGTEAA
jgi:signal transduction histidine kinase